MLLLFFFRVVRSKKLSILTSEDHNLTFIPDNIQVVIEICQKVSYICLVFATNPYRQGDNMSVVKIRVVNVPSLSVEFTSCHTEVCIGQLSLNSQQPV